jgi:hypothetical protein
MIGSKELRERVELLEYENKLIKAKLEAILDKDNKKNIPKRTMMISGGREYGKSYDELRRQYRAYTPEFKDGL